MTRNLNCLTSLFFIVQSVFCEPGVDKVMSSKIKETLSELVDQAKIPGMIAAISSSKGILAIGSSGDRKIGEKEGMTAQDLIHLGSCTKPMTALLLGILVNEGKLSWETPLIAALPELKTSIHRHYHTVTLWELLTHRAGVVANAKDWWTHGEMELKKRRLLIVQENLKKTSRTKRGSYHYSNMGYLIASCMAEKVTGSSWESLMHTRIFEPLGMSSAGFGPPGTTGKTDQPWGHSKPKIKWQPRQFDNAEALGPAGRVHCTIADWAKFISIQLPNGKKIGLNKKVLDKLITPIGTYAGGWIVTERPWGNGVVLTHTGSNTMWYAVVWIAPNVDRAFFVATNSRDNNSHRICDQMIGKLIEINRTN
jgi:CubicO group peptidase (beta-lactamase class C family)